MNLNQMILSKIDIKLAEQIMIDNLKNYLIKNPAVKSLILGVSGGFDSAFTAVIARKVCDEMGIKLYGFSITIGTNTPEEIQRAHDIGKIFCHEFDEHDMSEFFDYKIACGWIMEQGEHESEKQYKIRLGNEKARERMAFLYDMAQYHNGMVLSTDNLTELMLGFWTLHGDVGDYGLFQNLWKTECYAIARLIADNMENDEAKRAFRACINATPTDGLGITSSDVEQLGAKDYDEVEEILKAYFVDNTKNVNHPVVQRHLNTKFKRNNPFNLSRGLFLV